MSAAFRHPVVIVAVPLVFAALCPLLGLWRRKASFYWALAGTVVTAFLAWSLVGKVGPGTPLDYDLGGWRPPFGIEIRVDTLGLVLVCLITTLAPLLVVYSYRYADHEIPTDRLVYYYTLLLLVFTAMLGFSVTGDLFNFFVFMEIFSITSYALVAVSGAKESIRAAIKYVLMGAASSITILLAIAILYAATGSLNMADISRRLGVTGFGSAAAVALVLFTAGFAVKAALFPVHSWLPDAHSTAPSPVSALLSGLVIKMGVLGIARLLFTVYGRSFSALSPSWSGVADVLAWTAAACIVFGAAMAIFQKDLKFMIAYSSVSHIGYIMLGIALVNEGGLTGGFFNILAHGTAKACLFLVAGAFIFRAGVRRIADLKGLGRSMPFSSGAFTLAALSIIGLPPTAGFMAKWYIVEGCVRRGGAGYIFLALALLGTLLSAVYCLRVVYYLFFQPPSDAVSGAREAPASMAVPMGLLASGVLVLGVFSSWVAPALRAYAEVLLR